MSTAWVCQIDAATRGGAARTIRVASHDDERLCHLDEQLWWPAIERLPTLSYDFFDGAFGGEIVTPTGQAELSLDAIPGLAPLMLHGARIRWWSGELGDAWDGFVLRFDGLIESQPAVRGGKVGIDFRVDDRWLDDPLLATYAGTTGAEGEAALKGQVKPLLLGAPGMVEGVLANSIDTMIQLNDGPIAGVDVAFEGAARFAEPIGDYASYAALMAAPIAEGQWATALAAGWVRHGAPGDGVLTYDVQGSNAGADGGGQVRRAGAMILRLAARAGKSAKVDAAGLAAIDAARPWNLSRALTEQTTMRQVAQELAQSINAVALVTWTGLLTMLPIPLPEDAAPVGTLASDGSSLPPVASVDQLGIAPPWWQLAIEAEVTHRVLGSDEVRFTATLVDRGRYDPAESYREGHIVDLADGSRWLYTSMTPTSGNAPAEGSAYWTMISPARPIIAPTDITPTPPLELPEGTLWIAPDGHPYRFGTRPWIGSDGEAWIGDDGSPWLGGGYADVQDQVAVTALDIADAVTAQVARIADDGWLTAGEKSGLVLSHKAMIENYVALNAKAIAIGEAATERANATAAVNALNAYLVSLSPAWNDTTQDTAADADTITSLWGDAAQKVALLQAAIQGLPGPEGTPGINGVDGKGIEFVWKRAPTEPSAPTGNGIPSGWSDEPPEGADPLWMSKAKQELDGTLVSGETWSDPIRHDGPKGADGLSVAELTIYRRSGSAPATPTGGSYNFGTGVLTPPSGWSVTIPAGADPVYAASGVASKQGVTGSAAPNWMGVGKAFQDGADGANGTNGVDGSATNVIFRRSASQPSTPSPSAGVPSGWYDSTGSVPAGPDPIWASFGTRPTSTGNYAWQVAKRVEGQDGVSPLVATTSSSIQIDTDAGGVPKAGQMPRVLVYDVRYAGGDVKSAATISNLSAAGCSASIVGKNVEISALSATSGYVTIDWSYAGQTVSVRVDFMTKADGADGSTGRSTRIITKVSSTSYMALANTVALNASDTGKISARGSLDYAVNPGTPAQSCTLQIKAQYREAGGTWIDIAGTETTGSKSFYNVFDNLVEPGSVACPHTVVTGLTANAAYEVRLLGRRSAGSDYPASQTGSLYGGAPA